MTPFRRDGHLTDLALDVIVEDGSLEGTAAHLESCGVCRARVEAAAAVELPANPFAPVEKRGLPPQASVATPPAQPSAANRPWVWATLLVATAAALLVVANLPGEPAPDGIRIKGSGVALQVFRDQGDRSERLRDGDTIAAGDRLGFRIRNRNAGHLMVLGLDARDEAYLCYPQGGEGHSEAVTASEVATPLPEAIRMDDTPGTERLIAVFCDAAFTFDTIVDALQDDALPSDCRIDEVVLEKP